MSRHDPFAQYDGWQDTDEIKAGVERAFAEGAGVSVEKLQRALRRIVYDGHYGPVTDADWIAVDGKSMPLRKAKQIVRHAIGRSNLPTVALSHPDVGFTCDGAERCEHHDHADLGDDGPLFHEEPVRIAESDLIRWYFGALIPIYGTTDI